MSTYAVFGMTRHRAVEIARKSVETFEKGRRLTEAEWAAKVELMADEIMDSARCVQLSEKFDAPQFAKEFLALAKLTESRSLHIKAYAKTNAQNPKTGKPIMAWLDVPA